MKYDVIVINTPENGFLPVKLDSHHSRTVYVKGWTKRAEKGKHLEIDLNDFRVELVNDKFCHVANFV